MTPFGARLRELRQARGVTLSDMAREIGVSPTYLSALEHGRRGRPSWALVQQVIQYFNVIWDDAEELQRLANMSHPRVVIDTAGLSPSATRLANRLAHRIRALSERDLAAILALLEGPESGEA
ncbi:MAG: helix-turn-helix transcriptional regulator [Alsobacter sp.]